ncbi:MAG TPA: L,D-transpeptidase [Mycobacterium sp.]|nr:L,D-transpeptidase [Mycobacterium sp.]
MWAAVRAIPMVVSIAAVAVVAPAGASPATVSQLQGVAIASVLPAPGTVVGVAHPVAVTFRSPVINRRAAERAIAVQTTPKMTGKYEWLEDNMVQWVPDHFWPAHSPVGLSVGKLSADFKTGPAVLGVANISSRTFTVTVDGVEAGPLPAPHHRPHFGEDGVLPATMGKAEFPTPVGHYTVMAKDRSVVMDSSSVGIPVDDPEGYRVPVDYAVRITGRGLYVHSAPWALRSMGIDNVSHGCIGLSPADAEWYFNAVNIGDPVIVEK